MRSGTRLGKVRPDTDSPCGLSVPAERHRPPDDGGPAAHAIGWCTVTSLVPSGKVAST